MAFRFTAIRCCNCDRVLGSHIKTNLPDVKFFCVDCEVAIQGILHILKQTGEQDLAKALKNKAENKYVTQTLHDLAHKTGNYVKVDIITNLTYELWHTKMRHAIESIGTRLGITNEKNYRL